MFISVGSIVFFLIVIFLLYKRFLKTSLPEPKNLTSTEAATESNKNNATTAKQAVSNKKFTKFDYKKKSASPFSHPWLSITLKGHAGSILDFDFSTDRKFLASCDDERAIIVWNTSEFEDKDHKIVRGNIDFDHASKICVAPDSKSLLTCLHHDNKIVVHKIAKKDAKGQTKVVEVEGIEFKNTFNKLDVIDIGISCNGKFVMTASSDTTVVIWDLKGNVLKVIDTKQGNNYRAKVSPCGRFVACSGFTPDVKVWEVVFAKNGDFSDVCRAFELKGHSSGVRGFDFCQDSSRMVSCSKDGTFRLWNTDIRYSMGQEPYLLIQKPLDDLRNADFVSVAMSPNSDVAAIVTDKLIRLFCVESGELLGLIRDCESTNSTFPFSAVARFTADNRFLTVGRDKHILVFHNVAGYKVLARKSLEQIKKATSAAHKERLQQQADEAKAILDKYPSCN